MSDERCLCAPRPVGGDPQCVVHRDLHEARSAVRSELADLLRRFERPRTYAGDYEGDFAERILDLLGYAELRTIVRDLASSDPRFRENDPIIEHCVLCGNDRVHAEGCPWRRAVEPMSTQPEGDSDGE